MKAIVLNASPRKDWNTAQLLKSAMAGAQSNGAEFVSDFTFHLFQFLQQRPTAGISLPQLMDQRPHFRGPAKFNQGTQETAEPLIILPVADLL